MKLRDIMSEKELEEKIIEVLFQRAISHDDIYRGIREKLEELIEDLITEMVEKYIRPSMKLYITELVKHMYEKEEKE